MTLKSISPDAIPARSRASRSKITPELIEEAIKLLTAGQAVSPEANYKTEPAARRAMLALRKRIAETGTFTNGTRVSTRTWSEGDSFRGAVVLKETKAAKKS